MNTGKLVAEIAVLAIVVYCCYGAIVESLPTSKEELNALSSSPLDFETPELSGSLEGLDFKMQLDKGTITSHLPADIKDVFLTVYIGSGAEKYDLGTVNIGTLVPNTASPIKGEFTAPTYIILAYATAAQEDSSCLSIPICIKVGFKYFEWQGEHLVDLGVTIKQDFQFQGTDINFAHGEDGADASVSIELESGSNDILYSAAMNFKNNSEFASIWDGDTATLQIGDKDLFKIEIKTVGPKLTLSFEADGVKNTDGSIQTAEDLMKELVQPDGTLQIKIKNYDGNDSIPPIDADNAQTFISLIGMLYSNSNGGATA